MAVNDIAAGSLVGTWAPEQLFAGEMEVSSDSAPALAAITKYQLIAITATGVTPFVSGTHTADQAVVAIQAVSSGQQCPYYKSGCFNHEIIGWPAGATLDSFAKRKAFFGNRPLTVGKLLA